MSDPGRPRRRIEPDGPRRSKAPTDPWIITIIAAIVVVAGGWFLGQGLARIMGTREKPPAPAASSVVVPTPTATPVASPTVAASKSPKPKPKPQVAPSKATTAPSPRATPAATQPPTSAPTPRPTVAPTTAPAPARTPVPPKPKPTAAAAPIRTMVPRPLPQQGAAGNSAAENVVRGYIDALRRGDPQAAAAYLGNGSPDEDFIDESTRIVSVQSAANSDGSYRVSVAMRAAKGNYTETFVVAGAAGSEKILEKSAVKP